MNPFRDDNWVHPTAHVAIEAHSRMGKGNHIGAFCFIGENVIIGDNNTIDPFACIGTDGEYRGKDSQGIVQIGHNNHVGEFVTIHLPTEGKTHIGSDSMIMTKCHIAHDVWVGDSVTIAPMTSLGGFVEIRNFSNLGQGVIVHPRVVVGEGCMIGMNATITKHTGIWRKYVNVNEDIGENTKGRERWQKNQ